MTVHRQAFAIRIARDRAVEALFLFALCGAVVCAGVAGGVEMAGGVVLLGVRMRPARPAGRYLELRVDGDRWTIVGVDGALLALDPPVVHLAHRMIVVLEVVAAGRPDFLVFSPSTTPPDDLRRLRVRLRAGSR